MYFSKKEKEFLDILKGFRCRNWDQLKEELWSMYSSSCSSGSISPYAETYEPEYDGEARYEFAGQKANGSQALESKSYAASELGPSAGLCDMCGESPHDIAECRETRFLMFLGICDLDKDGMRDSSALPRAEGDGGSAWVIREREAVRTVMPGPSEVYSEVKGPTLDHESATLSAVEFNVHPSMEETDRGTLASKMGNCASSLDYTCSSTYEYTNGVVEFESEDFVSVKEEEDEYQYHHRDQFGDEIWSLPSSSESEREHLDSRLGHSQEYWRETEGSVDGNLPIGSKLHVISEFESSNLCTISQVLARDGSVLPQAEEKRAQVDQAFCTATPALIESELTCALSIDTLSNDPEYETVEGLADWNVKDSSILPDLSDSTGIPSAQCSYEETMSTSWIPFDSFHSVDSMRNYEYMDEIDKFVSVEEEGEIHDEPSHPPPSSLVPESSQSSYDMAYHSSLRSLSSMMHFGAQELSRPSASLDFESQVESGLDLLDFQSILRMSLAQPTPLNYTRVSSSSIEVNHELQAVNKPHHSSVHSLRAKNMEIICASLGRSFIKLDEGL